jgi:hypothetical protein
MEPGVHVGNDSLIDALNQRVAVDAVRSVQLEAAVQQLLAESAAMSQKIIELEQAEVSTDG